jgi:hypothetical protein
MSTVKIPIERISPEVLQRVVEEFVSRNGTDYGKTEIPLEIKIRQVEGHLKSGQVVLVYDNETQTCNIFSADDPVLMSIS